MDDNRKAYEIPKDGNSCESIFAKNCISIEASAKSTTTNNISPLIFIKFTKDYYYR